tara:strand:- start:69 stop:383 length:315 start_codon:yes stop_codon:yes gene_type:complete
MLTVVLFLKKYNFAKAKKITHMNQEIYAKLTEIIKPYLPEDVDAASIAKDSHLVNDLSINSTHLVDIVLDVEDAFDITIEDDELDKMETVAASIALIEQKSENK